MAEPARAPDRPLGPPTAARERDFAVSGLGLHLRYPGMHDAPALFALASDSEVTRFLSWGPYEEEAQASTWLRTLPGRRAAGAALELAVVDEQEKLIGITLLSEFSRRDRRCVVGTWLGRAHWGTGANLKAKTLLAELAFGTLGIERLGAYADVRHHRSQVALGRAGFTREGVLRAFHRHRDQPRDVVIYSLLRDDWPRSPLAPVGAVICGSPAPAFRAGTEAAPSSTRRLSP